MNAARFDHFSRMLGRRLSRRSALRRGGSAASAAALVAVGFRHAGAQDATPAAPDAFPTATSSVSFLFVQFATAASWTAKDGQDGAYVLSLTHQHNQTVYFSDRPERITGSFSTQHFLRKLGFGPDDPPNAAIVARGQVLVVELLNPSYDLATGILTYDAAPIEPTTARDGLQHLAQGQTGSDLPADLGPTSLFIDSGELVGANYCGQYQSCFYGNTSDPDTPGDIPNGPYDLCYVFLYGCYECSDHDVSADDLANQLASTCNDGYSECDGQCYVIEQNDPA